jgi:hypothetical protein
MCWQQPTITRPVTETAQEHEENTQTQATTKIRRKGVIKIASDNDDADNNNNSLTCMAMLEALGKNGNKSELCF